MRVTEFEGNSECEMSGAGVDLSGIFAAAKKDQQKVVQYVSCGGSAFQCMTGPK